MPAKPAQRVLEAENALVAALGHVRTAIRLLEGPHPGYWAAADKELAYQRRMRLFLAHRLHGLLAGGRIPPRSVELNMAVPYGDDAQDEQQQQDEQQEIPGSQGSADQGGRDAPGAVVGAPW